MFPMEEPPAAEQPRAPVPNTAHSGRELRSGKTQPQRLTNHHMRPLLCPRPPAGTCHHRHSPTAALSVQEAVADQPSLPSMQEPLKKTSQDLVMSSGLRNLANEEERAKISDFCQTPGKYTIINSHYINSFIHWPIL